MAAYVIAALFFHLGPKPFRYADDQHDKPGIADNNRVSWNEHVGIWYYEVHDHDDFASQGGLPAPDNLAIGSDVFTLREQIRDYDHFAEKSIPPDLDMFNVVTPDGHLMSDQDVLNQTNFWAFSQLVEDARHLNWIPDYMMLGAGAGGLLGAYTAGLVITKHTPIDHPRHSYFYVLQMARHRHKRELISSSLPVTAGDISPSTELSPSNIDPRAHSRDFKTSVRPFNSSMPADALVPQTLLSKRGHGMQQPKWLADAQANHAVILRLDANETSAGDARWFQGVTIVCRSEGNAWFESKDWAANGHIEGLRHDPMLGVKFGNFTVELPLTGRTIRGRWVAAVRWPFNDAVRDLFSSWYYVTQMLREQTKYY